MLAFIAAAIAMAVLKAHYVFILVFATTAVFAGIVGFKCRYKSYDIDGHEVVLYSGLFKNIYAWTVKSSKAVLLQDT